MGVKRVMRGKDLAEKAKLHPATISGYLTGKSKGPRTVEERQAICEALQADYNEVIAAGRKEDAPSSSDLEDRLSKIESSLKASTQNSNMTTLEEHRYILKEFRDQELALEVNRKLIKAEKAIPSILREGLAYIQSRTGDGTTTTRKRQGPEGKSSAS
jgi:transcriptional regulator with XRE-family HTH domain